MSDGLFGSFFGPIFGNNQRTDVTTVKTVHEIVQREDAEILRLRAEVEKLRASFIHSEAKNDQYRIDINEIYLENRKLRAALKETLEIASRNEAGDYQQRAAAALKETE